MQNEDRMTFDTESHLRAEIDRLHARVAELESSADAASTVPLPRIIESCRAVLSKRSFEDIAQSLFNACKRAIGAQSGYIALLSRDGNTNDVLFLDAGGLECTVDPKLPMPVRGLRETAYMENRPVYDNGFIDSDWMRFMPEGHVRLENVLFAPIIIDGRPAGLVGLANKDGGFDGNDCTVASAFADLAAIALMNSRTMEALERSGQQFRSVTLTALDAIVTTDSLFNVISWNDGASHMFGYESDEVLLRPFSDLLAGDDASAHFLLPGHASFGDDSRELSETVELEMARADGSVFPAEMTFSSWEGSGEQYLTFIIRNISERKASERALQKARDELELRVRERTAELTRTNEDLRNEVEQRKRAEAEIRSRNAFLHNIVNSLAHPFYVVDASDYSVILANSACGVSGPYGGRTCHELIFGRNEPCEGSESPCPLSLARETGEAAVVEHVIHDQDGVRYFEVHGHPIHDESGGVSQFIEYAFDVTGRKEAEKEFAEGVKIVERSSRLASIGVMTAGINHEINQPLTAIKFHVDGLLYWEKNNRGVVPEMVIESLRDISDSVRRIDEIIKHMRAFWKSSDRAEKDLFDLNDAVEHALSLLDRQLFLHGVSIDRDLDADGTLIFGNQLHIEQVVINLVVNAMHALDAIEAEDKTIIVSTKNTDNGVRLEVIDNGPGLPEAVDRLLDPFFTTGAQDSGMGLGLSIVKYFVEEHDGMLDIMNNDARGANVSMLFPRHRQAE